MKPHEVLFRTTAVTTLGIAGLSAAVHDRPGELYPFLPSPQNTQECGPIIPPPNQAILNYPFPGGEICTTYDFERSANIVNSTLQFMQESKIPILQYTSDRFAEYLIDGTAYYSDSEDSGWDMVLKMTLPNNKKGFGIQILGTRTIDSVSGTTSQFPQIITKPLYPETNALMIALAVLTKKIGDNEIGDFNNDDEYDVLSYRAYNLLKGLPKKYFDKARENFEFTRQ